MSTTSPYFKTKDLKIPPHSYEAEKALLGSVIIRGEAMHDIVDIVSEQSFYSNQNRMVWAALFELHSKSAAIDVLTLSARLKEKNELEQVGGMTALTELI